MRVGFGYDAHRLVKNRPLILGGVDIPYEFGLFGHSDADVLIHSIMDSLLGALALGDIGKHFPDSDEQYEGISSLKLLKRVSVLISEAGYTIGNIDITIVAQKPKVAPYIDSMRKNIARTLSVESDRVSIKATTEEGMGFSGREEGIGCYSICLLQRY